MKKLIVLLTVVILLAGCDLLGNNSTTNTTPTPAVTTWGNMIPVANTYELTATTLTLDDYIAYGQVAATTNAICAVIWETATSVFASCRNVTSDGQWPATCTVNTDATVSCGLVNTATLYFLSAMGASRTLTVEEAELADEIRRVTYCDAPRRDGSASPCVIS